MDDPAETNVRRY